jgi:hypothetical protein
MAQATRCSCPEGEVVIAGFGNIPEVFVGGLIFVGHLAIVLGEVSQGHIVKLL